MESYAESLFTPASEVGEGGLPRRPFEYGGIISPNLNDIDLHPLILIKNGNGGQSGTRAT